MRKGRNENQNRERRCFSSIPQRGGKAREKTVSPNGVSASEKEDWQRGQMSPQKGSPFHLLVEKGKKRKEEAFP